MTSLDALFSLSGKTALVTGGATGIGASIARTLAACGARVAITTHSSPPERPHGQPLDAVRIDLARSSPAELTALVDQVEATCGEIDILVNNAGIIRRAPAATHPAEDWNAVLDLNLTVPFSLSQIVGRRMIERAGGKIIMMASMLSFQGGMTVPGYAASKHAIAGVTKALANEWAGQKINVNAIAPGYIETAATRALREDPGRSAEILGRIPAGRWGTPDDIGGAAAFLASPASDYVNGHVLACDGGWLAR